MEQNKQQTAVDWIYDQIEQYKLTFGDIPINVLQKYRKQAKQMEKEQIVNAWIATDNELQRIAAEHYYNDTYGTE
jgi:hypothetical protein